MKMKVANVFQSKILAEANLRLTKVKILNSEIGMQNVK
ncbi:MAG: hypothetical protein RJA07_726 [Bacteroidota bacterium]|jgi:predicted nucleic acid-binding protein